MSRSRFKDSIMSGSGWIPKINSYTRAAIGIRRIISDYRRYFGTADPENLICDIGSGRRNFLRALIDEGYHAIGCEVSKQLTGKSREFFGFDNDQLQNLGVIDFIDRLRARQSTPRVFVLWHVIEHIPGSLEVMKKLKAAASDTVTFVIQTPMPTPLYVYPEDLFFPNPETYHYVAVELNLLVKFLKIVPYTRFLTCILSNDQTEPRFVLPAENERDEISMTGHFIQRLNSSVNELLTVVENQKRRLEATAKV